VSLTFLDKEEDKDANKVKYPKKVFEKINQLKDRFSLNEICVLTRTKKRRSSSCKLFIRKRS
jgi:hypothetical protein